MMIERRTLRWTGAFGLACTACWGGRLLLRLAGGVPIHEGAALAEHLAAAKDVVLTRVLLGHALYVALLVFSVGLRHLVRRAQPERESAGALVVPAAVVWVAVTLVADGLEGGAVLDAGGGHPDPSVVRALLLGSILVHDGSIALALTATFLGSAARATLASGVLPRWSAWLAIAGTMLCVACIPATYFGPVDGARFYHAGGWGPAVVANLAPFVWFLSVSVWMVGRGTRRRERVFGRLLPVGRPTA